MIIPKEIKVRTRKNGSETPLGFATYVDENGKIRLERAWNEWGDTEIGPFVNEPTTGFKLAGLTKRSADWFGSGRTMFYIVHPKGFEFEITADNLFALMGYHDIIKGEIMGELVLVWDKFALSLISVDSTDYEKYKEQTSTISKGVVAMKDLIPGRIYTDREGTSKLVYVGNYHLLLGTTHYVRGTEIMSSGNWYNRWDNREEVSTVHVDKFHIFRGNKRYNDGTYEYVCCKTKKCFDSGKNIKHITVSDINAYITNFSHQWYSGIHASGYTAVNVFESKPNEGTIAKYITEGTDENTLVHKVVGKQFKTYIEKDYKIIR